MAHVRINLKANVPTRQGFGPVRFITLQSLGAAATVDIEVEAAGFARETARNLRPGDRLSSEVPFDSVSFTATVDCAIDVFASMLDLRLNTSDGSTVTANIAGTVPVNVVGPNPLPVVASRGGDVATPMFVTGLTLSETPAATVTDNAGVVFAAGAASAQVLAADPTRLEVVFFNQGPDSMALGMPGITWAKRAIVVAPGDTWLEWRAASKAWHALPDPAGLGGATITTQVRKS